MKKNNTEINKKSPALPGKIIENLLINLRKDCQFHCKHFHRLQLKGTAGIRIRHRIEAVRYVCLAKVMVNRKRMVKVGRV